ncbi:Formylglycine-generating sulfatase enzyme [Anatilimnocola aggregata]|uniref:Formylglycine-generating sulfatase enzyme n=1 Tax=Anatilimnocola aggregata TaxID=2528021 RepID=A0A517YNQ2_9BACT|nr:SUMF1/EgtB/PvdO family nonheme iron enzyme [Anatilimnocola aggregata]QDU31847.1 Formylglycine-generating sulfatase enzyme [Anatilimnocola aggregata]
MKFIKRANIDGEVDQFEIQASRPIRGIESTLTILFDEWMRVRNVQKLCDCFPKHYSIESSSDDRFVTIFAGWFCDRCLPVLGNLIAERLPHITSVTVGSDLGEFPLPEQRLMSFIGAIAHFENGNSMGVPPFAIYRAPVTTAEFDVFTQTTGYVTTSEKNNDGSFRLDATLEPLRPADRGNVPVHNVSYVDVEAYCQWAGVRLPTEAELLAAALVDQRILSRSEHETFMFGDEGRFDITRFPNALEHLHSEFVASDDTPGKAIVRSGSYYVRKRDWNTTQNRAIVHRTWYDLMTGFRVCATKSPT